MHARVSTYQASDTDGLLEGFRSVTGDLEQVDGFSHALFLVDRESGKAMSITVWDSEDALNASVQQAEQLRQRGTQPSGTKIESVQHYEVPITAGSMASN
jgi:heme-degrading monooxygenase HmoA